MCVFACVYRYLQFTEYIKLVRHSHVLRNWLVDVPCARSHICVWLSERATVRITISLTSFGFWNVPMCRWYLHEKPKQKEMKKPAHRLLTFTMFFLFCFMYFLKLENVARKQWSFFDILSMKLNTFYLQFCFQLHFDFNLFYLYPLEKGMVFWIFSGTKKCITNTDSEPQLRCIRNKFCVSIFLCLSLVLPHTLRNEKNNHKKMCDIINIVANQAINSAQQ